MTFTRVAVTTVEILGCAVSVYLAEKDMPTPAFLLAVGMVLLAWAEGRNGWGSLS